MDISKDRTRLDSYFCAPPAAATAALTIVPSRSTGSPPADFFRPHAALGLASAERARGAGPRGPSSLYRSYQ